MAIVKTQYNVPFWLNNGHVQTIFPSLFRKVSTQQYERERLETPDQDFIDLDWSFANISSRSKALVIISHGLEGSTDRHYVAGMARAFNQQGVDALPWNFRSCSGEINRTPRFYHSGEIGDLTQVVNHAADNGYEKIYLVGFSLGGNVTLVYLGKNPSNVHPNVKGAAVFSVPCDLSASSVTLAQFQNKIYMNRFVRDLGKKIKIKSEMFPETVSHQDYNKVKTFKHFDGTYTAPIHGFESAEAYWQACSSKQFLKDIAVPTLMVNAQDDPFLPDECYPFDIAEGHHHFHLEVPETGGHVGFVSFSGHYFSEQRALEFLLD